MNDHDPDAEPSKAFLEIARKFYPRSRCAPRGMRSFNDAAEWAGSLDWRNNPYDRFLLGRELLLHFLNQMHENPRRSVLRFATRVEIEGEIDHMIKEFPADCERLGPDLEETLGIFTHILLILPWRLADKHGLVRYRLLTKALRFIRT